MSNQKIVTETALSALASDIKNALSGKANSNDVYPKSQTYNRTEIDNALELKADKSELYNVYPTEQESGSIVHITDGGDNIPMKSLVSQIIATGGGGTPDAPIAINGFDSGIITRCGKNLIPMTVASVKAINTLGTWSGNAYTYNNVVYTIQTDESGNITSISANGTANATSSFNIATNFVLQKGSYILNGCPSGGGTELARLQVNTGTLNIDTGTGANFTLTDVYKSCICFIRVGSGYNPNGRVFKPMVRIASDTDDTFAISNFNTYTFTFGQTVYGGHFDNKGNLVVTHEIIDLGDLTYTYYTGGTNPIFYGSITDAKVYSDGDTINAICSCYDNFGVSRNRTNLSSLLGDNQFSFISNGTNLTIRNDSYTDANAFKTAMSGQKVVYELATPITLAITSQDIPTLLGENNIFSNCGDVEVEYHADIGLYIDKKVSSLAQG